MALKSPGVSSLVDRHRNYFDLDRRGEFDKLDRSLNTSSEQCEGKIYFQQVQENNYLKKRDEKILVWRDKQCL